MLSYNDMNDVSYQCQAQRSPIMPITRMERPTIIDSSNMLMRIMLQDHMLQDHMLLEHNFGPKISQKLSDHAAIFCA